MTEQIMTDRLYYRDQGLLEFDATVTRAEEKDGHWHTFLDRSAFYPTSGGQLNDTGEINGVAVLDVVETEDGDVAHLTETSIGEPGTPVRGRVDADRRWQHRQQHTAQHILSAVFLDLFGAATVSVHLGAEYGAVEFDAAVFDSNQLHEAEQKANQILRENYPVKVSFVDGHAADEVPFRRPPKRSGKLRVVQIGDFEYAACGGTHCDSTGQVGMIKIIALGKLRGHALVHFLSGMQAVTDYGLRFDVTDRLSRTLTCGVADLPEKLEDLLAQEKELKQRLNALYGEMLPVLVEEIIARNTSKQIVSGKSELPDIRLAARLASLVASKTGRVACLLNSGNLVLATEEDSGCDLRVVARALNAATELKGGGSKSLIQFGRAEVDRFQSYVDVVEESLGHG